MSAVVCFRPAQHSLPRAHLQPPTPNPDQPRTKFRRIRRLQSEPHNPQARNLWPSASIRGSSGICLASVGRAVSSTQGLSKRTRECRTVGSKRLKRLQMKSRCQVSSLAVEEPPRWPTKHLQLCIWHGTVSESWDAMCSWFIRTRFGT